VFSNLFSFTLPNIGKYFPGIHFPRNSLSKRKLLSSKQKGKHFPENQVKFFFDWKIFFVDQKVFFFDWKVFFVDWKVFSVDHIF
jgi:hypothetical protein